MGYALAGTPYDYQVSGKQITIVDRVAQYQGNKITGTVFDEDGKEPLIGAQVKLDGTKLATVTDINGAFSFNVAPHKGQHVTVTDIGMKAQSLQASAEMKVVMKSDSKQLGDVVVNGFFTRKKQTYTGAAKTVSTDRDLDYKFLTGGTYYAHLTVTDGSVGKAMDYRINVNRLFEEGLMICSTDADGHGNLAFIKTLTPEDIEQGKDVVITEHSFARMNEGLSEDGLVGANLVTVTYPTTLTRLSISTRDHCYYLDANNLTLLTDMSYADVVTGFKAGAYYADTNNGNPYAYDFEKKQDVFVDLNYMFPYVYDRYADFYPSNITQCKYQGWQGLNYQTFYPDYEKNSVTVYDAYQTYYGNDPFVSTGDKLADYNLLTVYSALAPDDATYQTYMYIMARQKSTGDFCLWQLTTSSVGTTDFSSPTKRLTPSADAAIPTQGTLFAGSVTYERMFYVLDNRIYVYLPNATSLTLPTKEQYALKYSDKEEITCIESDFDRDELYVATFDSSTRRANIYVYDCKDVRTDNAASIQPKKVYKSCCGKVSSMFYKTSIQ